MSDSASAEPRFAIRLFSIAVVSLGRQAAGGIAMVRDTSIIAAFVSLDVGRACGERVWGCVHCAGDGHVAHPVSAGDVDQGLTFIVTLASFLALVGIELEWAAHMHTAGLVAAPTFPGSGSTQPHL